MDLNLGTEAYCPTITHEYVYFITTEENLQFERQTYSSTILTVSLIHRFSRVDIIRIVGEFCIFLI